MSPSPVHGPDGLRGLSSREAAARLASDGPNELAAARRRGLSAALLASVREPMTLLLLGCGGIYIALGDLHESLMLVGFVVLILGITLAEERKTEKALDALRDLASPRALVIRDGVRVRIAGREVVRGDLVVIAEGDRVPADVRIASSSHLSVDESILTGESVAVRKAEWDGQASPARPGGDDSPFAYAGTLVASGSAIASVYATGASTEIGKIGRAMTGAAPQPTMLQRETRRLVARLAWTGASLSAVVVVAYALLRHDWLGGVLAGLTLAMAVLPNEFPVVVTIFLAMGAWRLSRHRVLARSIPAVESLGSATVLCVDKTGTLTENRMRVARLVGTSDEPFDEPFDVARLAHEPLPERVHQVVEYAILASRRDPFDPMEKAFLDLGEHHLAGTEHLHPDGILLREWPLSRELLAVTQAWSLPGSDGCVIATKGAPEAVASLCGFDEARRAHLAEEVRALAERGLRVLGVARSAVESAAALPDDVRALPHAFVGLVGLADPLRPDVPAAVAECRTAGIRVAMITGDYPATAEAIARQAGIEPSNVALRGDEIDALDDGELARRVLAGNVFARVLPEQKLRLVRAFQSHGEVVAMTGDGVNDAPALTAAHIGIAMGARGTDVAREAAELVLLEDDFASLVGGVRVGRRIIDNLKKALAFVLAVHLPIVGLTVIPIAMGWPLVLMPIHIAFLHLIIDPACSVVFEAEPDEHDLMRRPPRDPDAPLFGSRVVVTSSLQGAIVLAVTIGVLASALRRGDEEAHARALTFATLIVANLGLIFTNRSWSESLLRTARAPNPWLWWVTSCTLALLGVIVYVPPVAELFRFSPLAGADLLGCAATGALAIAGCELLKIAARRFPHRPGASPAPR